MYSCELAGWLSGFWPRSRTRFGRLSAAFGWSSASATAGISEAKTRITSHGREDMVSPSKSVSKRQRRLAAQILRNTCTESNARGHYLFGWTRSLAVCQLTNGWT